MPCSPWKVHAATADGTVAAEGGQACYGSCHAAGSAKGFRQLCISTPVHLQRRRRQPEHSGQENKCPF